MIHISNVWVQHNKISNLSIDLDENPQSKSKKRGLWITVEGDNTSYFEAYPSKNKVIERAAYISEQIKFMYAIQK